MIRNKILDYQQFQQQNSMKPKQQHLKNNFANKQQTSGIRLSQLSISSIKEKDGHDQTLDFQYQKQIISQLKGRAGQLHNEYGIYDVFKKRKNQQKYRFEESLQSPRIKVQLEQNKICFNKQIKRKKPNSKSKEILKNPSNLLKSSNSLSKLNFNSYIRQLKNQGRKNLGENIKKNPIIILDTKNILKLPKILLKIYDMPIQHLRIHNDKESTRKLYYQMADQVKLQLKDINHNLNSNIFKLNGPSNAYQNLTKKSLKKLQSKRSSFIEQQQNLQMKQHKNFEIMKRNNSQLVLVKKPLSVDGRNSSFYSSRTQTYQSPFSKDSNSTATHRQVRRSEIYQKSNKQQQQYFLRGSSKDVFLQ